jgi:sulfur relay (sulfurtransferase) complex TusBCD TusD component (DsrE family)
MTAAVQRDVIPHRPRRLSILIAAGPETEAFDHGVKLARASLKQGVQVYLYCIDDAIGGLGCGPMGDLRLSGARVYGCAYAAERRGLPLDANMIYGGLALLSDLMVGSDRFVAFGGLTR